jgi:type IV secretory pathway VirB2 component (pilin)
MSIEAIKPAQRSSFATAVLSPAPKSGGNSLYQSLFSFFQRRKTKMKTILRRAIRFRPTARQLTILAFSLLLAVPVFAQAANSPWENAVNVLQTAFTSTIARGLSLVAIVVAGLTFAFGEGGSKKVFAGVLFGVGMAIAAVNFIAWLFPGN